MRHSYATALLIAGNRDGYCAKQMGHSVEMFHRTYAKWCDGDHNRIEEGRLDAYLQGIVKKDVQVP